MAYYTSIPIETLRQLISYDSETGILTWLHRERKWFKTDLAYQAWNARYAGKEAVGSLKTHGYKGGQIFNTHVLAHRVAWALHHGAWPDKQIDHLNGERADNRIVNLRHATRLENARNQKIPCDNRTGRIGVEAVEKDGVWVAKIRNHGRSVHLGRWPTFELACAARYGAEVALGYHPNHGRP